MPVPPYGAAPGTHGPINPHAKESGNGRDPEYHLPTRAHQRCLMTTKNKQSVLGAELREIADSHPGVKVHPNSPVGPYVRAVLWTAKVNGCQLRGQILWDTNIGDGRWTVRAFDEADPQGLCRFCTPHPSPASHSRSMRFSPVSIAGVGDRRCFRVVWPGSFLWRSRWRSSCGSCSHRSQWRV